MASTKFTGFIMYMSIKMNASSGPLFIGLKGIFHVVAI
jgi:hypothetical protein